MLLDGHEAESHELSVLSELLGVDAAQDLNHLGCQLEWSLFEFNALARCVWEQEAEVDVHDVPEDVHHDVAVVAVLDLEDVADETVSGQGLAEVVSRFSEL